ncbi:MAG: citramalate synthase [Planctomycetota bacterium]|nr:citramalate synthase [Planctomycetota bacterium]
MSRIEIYDTTLRDGAQAEGISFSLQDKLLLAKRLDSMGFDFIEGGYPGSNEKDMQFFQRVAEMDLAHVKVCAFGMTRRKGIAAEDDAGLKSLLDSKAPIITLVGKASEFQVAEVLRADMVENIEMIADSVAHLVAAGREVIFDGEHFFDGYRHNRQYALDALQAAVRAGATRLVLCDTNGGTMPDEIARNTAEVVEMFGPRVGIGIHAHNDCDLSAANSLAAVRAGATQVQGTINGFGERCGNADLIAIVANLALKMPEYEVLSGQAVEHLTELSRYVYEMVNMNFRERQPFVGKSAFAHKGGMHVSGIARNTASYEHITPQSVGNERRVLVSELSGRSNLVELANKHNIEHDAKLMDKILARVVSMENAGYQFEAADGSFDLLVKRCTGTFRPHFERLSYHVNVETEHDGAVTTEATVKIHVPGKDGEEDEIRHEVAEGDGPINALDAAMRKALNGTFPTLRDMHLVDYKVRVINSEAATAAGVRVVVESQDDTDVWGTVGVSENIIEASWIALADSLEYKLYKDEKNST